MSKDIQTLERHIEALQRIITKNGQDGNTYPFAEGETYYVLYTLDNSWLESVWDEESENLHDHLYNSRGIEQLYFSPRQHEAVQGLLEEKDEVIAYLEDKVYDLEERINKYIRRTSDNNSNS